MRKTLVIFFFVVVFGLPVAWYLFLQVFGENHFELPKIEQWDSGCHQLSGPSLVVKEGSFDDYPNQWIRVNKVIQNQNLISLIKVEDCKLLADCYLVDEEGWVRGSFQVSREEIDRLLAEIDIYTLNYNEPGN